LPYGEDDGQRIKDMEEKAWEDTTKPPGVLPRPGDFFRPSSWINYFFAKRAHYMSEKTKDEW